MRVCKDMRANAQLWERVVNLQHVAVGDEVDGHRTTPLIHCAAADDVARVREALDRGARVDACNSHGFTALYYAVGDVAAELLARGAADGVRARHGIVDAAWDGNTALGVDLVARGADIEVRDATGWTPLMYSCHAGHAATAAEFLRLGADVNAQDSRDDTSLTLAVWGAHTDVVRVLLAAPGVDVNAVANGHTALSLARTLGQAAIVALLEAAGAH